MKRREFICCICSRPLVALPRHSKIGDERLLSEEERSCSRHHHNDRV